MSAILKKIEENFQKGAIDTLTFLKAMVAYNTIEKGGEGSRGGKIIGHTKSGKPIYDTYSHEGHKDFSVNDHEDAFIAHSKKWIKSKDKGKDAKHHEKQMDDHSKHSIEEV